MENSVFLVCDVQERFRTLIHKFDHVALTSSIMVKASKIMGIPCVVTEQYPKALGHTCSEVLAGDTSPLIKVFEKSLFSMMTPEVEQHLKDLNRNSAVIFGVETHVCVQQTALDLLEKGWDVHVIVDGVSSQREFDRSVAIERLKAAGAFLTTSESLLFGLMKDSNYENFKAVSQLVKEYGTSVKSTNPLSLL